MDEVGTVSDYIVGSMMILIGSAAIISLYKWHKRRQRQLLHLRDIETNHPRLHPADGCPLPILGNSEAHVEAHEYNFTHRHVNENDDENSITTSNTLWSRFRRWRMGDTFTDSPTSAYVIGGVHGISGLSGVVYVLPALFLDDTDASTSIPTRFRNHINWKYVSFGWYIRSYATRYKKYNAFQWFRWYVCIRCWYCVDCINLYG